MALDVEANDQKRGEFLGDCESMWSYFCSLLHCSKGMDYADDKSYSVINTDLLQNEAHMKIMMFGLGTKPGMASFLVASKGKSK